jgi:hypothetical protein
MLARAEGRRGVDGQAHGAGGKRPAHVIAVDVIAPGLERRKTRHGFAQPVFGRYACNHHLGHGDIQRARGQGHTGFDIGTRRRDIEHAFDRP